MSGAAEGAPKRWTLGEVRRAGAVLERLGKLRAVADSLARSGSAAFATLEVKGGIGWAGAVLDRGAAEEAVRRSIALAERELEEMGVEMEAKVASQDG